MSGAAKVAAPAEAEAPFGYTTDPDTGERRPKKAAGRPRKSPGLDQLKASQQEAAATSPAAEPAGDRAPVPGRRRGAQAPAADDAAIPQHRPGVITKGINRLYRRAGKIVLAMDADIGNAIIGSTRNTAEDGEPDDSVGAAWDELARTNPRVRRVLLKMIAGGAWGQVIMAHAPMLLAIIMKDGIAKHIPFVKLIAAFMEPDEGATPSQLAAALKPEDLGQMMKLAQDLMGRTAGQAAA